MKWLMILFLLLLVPFCFAVTPELILEEIDDSVVVYLLVNNTDPINFSDSFSLTVNIPGEGVAMFQDYIDVPAGKAIIKFLYAYDTKGSYSGDFFIHISSFEQNYSLDSSIFVKGDYDELFAALVPCFNTVCDGELSVGIKGDTFTFASYYSEGTVTSYILLSPDGSIQSITESFSLIMEEPGKYELIGNFSGERIKSATRKMEFTILSKEPLILSGSTCGNDICDEREYKDTCPYDCVILEEIEEITQENIIKDGNTKNSENKEIEETKEKPSFRIIFIFIPLLFIILIIALIKKSVHKRENK